MNCIVCGAKLGDNSYEYLGRNLRLHTECVTNDVKKQIEDIYRPFLYKKEGKLMKGFFHKPHEEL